ncbi:FAD-dependent thymidylate synthase [Streptomyces sp. NPDC060020]|uniref:FAD-dependent thymidylate synthase n=1 Tax=Streptomyces sp. NPDC060020 TaxID=3347038 RepID=UPI0036B8F328
MKVTVAASTRISEHRWDDCGPAFPVQTSPEFDTLGDDPSRPVTDADELAEFAGRACYKSWSKPNPATAANSDYLRNIIHQGHFSVLEHASVTFYVEGVSRALLLELERHRFLSFSVESQRYVDTEKHHPEPVLPPAIAPDSSAAGLVRDAYAFALNDYGILVQHLSEKGLKRKEAREAARAVLPNATPVDFLVTGNLRAWRDVLGKRWHEAADAEIREFAGLILGHLRDLAPGAVQDVPRTPFTY